MLRRMGAVEYQAGKRAQTPLPPPSRTYGKENSPLQFSSSVPSAEHSGTLGGRALPIYRRLAGASRQWAGCGSGDVCHTATEVGQGSDRLTCPWPSLELGMSTFPSSGMMWPAAPPPGPRPLQIGLRGAGWMRRSPHFLPSSRAPCRCICSGEEKRNAGERNGGTFGLRSNNYYAS